MAMKESEVLFIFKDLHIKWPLVCHLGLFKDFSLFSALKGMNASWVTHFALKE